MEEKTLLDQLLSPPIIDVIIFVLVIVIGKLDPTNKVSGLIKKLGEGLDSKKKSS